MPQLFEGILCCAITCSPKNLFIGVDVNGEILCIQPKCCLGLGKPHPIGMIKEEGMICKAGLPCCTMGLKSPWSSPLSGVPVSA